MPVFHTPAIETNIRLDRRQAAPAGALTTHRCPSAGNGTALAAARRSRADRFPGLRIRDTIPAVSSAPPPAATDAALRSVHTSNLPALFGQLQVSVVVSTYQAGKVILIRNDEGVLNTHFRTFGKPMGIAGDRARLTIGGTNTVWYYRNLPAVAGKLEPPGKYDACYLPRRVHVTGDIDIHELCWDAKDELWVVNTRFGCLCTLDGDHSFYPRWRPPFLSALAPEDRCHLNGLCLIDGRPRYVTALGETDTPGGWRANKRSGGLLMDIDKNEILLRGLSMPHSPRWYQGQLWVLESGQGSLAVADLERGTWRTVAEVPGFTRGLDFYGPLAFIGLSQVRETAVFSGIPLVERLRERTCGVWIVHIESAETVGFLRFDAGVQEIFAVQVLPGIRFPELLEWNDERLAHSYVLPDEALALVKLPTPEELARSPGFHFQHGTKSYHESKLAEAIAAYRECLRLDPAFPNARYNLGVALGDAEEYEEAMTCLEAVVEAESERPETYNSLRYLTNRQRHPEEAIAHYERAIELRPDYAEAHFNLGMTLLQLGDYRRGLPEYEWRWQTGQFTPFACPHPKWDGDPIPDKTLLIPTEQGAGDAIQFARYLALAAERCRRLILVCRADLMPLFATIPGIAELREAGTIQVGLGVRHLLSLAEPAAGLRHDLGDPPGRRALPRHRDLAEAQDAIDIAGRDPTEDRHRVGREPDVSERPPSLHRALRAPADPAAPGLRFLQPAEGRALPGPPRAAAGLPGTGPRSVPGGLRRHRARCRCPRSRHHRGYRGCAPRRRPRQTGVDAAPGSAGLALGPDRPDHSLVPEHAALPSGPPERLGRSHGPGLGGAARGPVVNSEW